MRRFVTTLLILLVAAFCLVFLLFVEGNGREKSFPDGTIVRLEKIGFTTNFENIEPGGRLEKLKKTLVEWWQSKFLKKPPAYYAGMSSWYIDAITRSNEPALYIYISRRTPAKGYQSVQAQVAELIDEHGCVYAAAQTGGSDDGRLSASSGASVGGMNSSIGWFRFEAFPRREKKFRFRVYDNTWGGGLPSTNGPPSIEFTIANPAPRPKITEWSPQSLPITCAQDNVSFILTNVAVKSKSNIPGSFGAVLGSSFLSASFQVIEDGQPSTNWRALYSELYDASGNFVSPQFAPPAPLCSQEPAWKLRVNFFGSEKSHAASNALWTITNLTVPASGESTAIEQTNVLQGVPIRFGSFGGPGNFDYSNAIALYAENRISLFAQKPRGRVENDTTSVLSWPRIWNGKPSKLKPTFSLKTTKPHLAIEIGDLTGHQRLTVRAVDEKGREYYGHKVYNSDFDSLSGKNSSPMHYIDSWNQGEGGFVLLDFPEDVNKVDLTFCIHTCRTAEFIFKPPLSPAKIAKNSAVQ